MPHYNGGWLSEACRRADNREPMSRNWSKLFFRGSKKVPTRSPYAKRKSVELVEKKAAEMQAGCKHTAKYGK